MFIEWMKIRPIKKSSLFSIFAALFQSVEMIRNWSFVFNYWKFEIQRTKVVAGLRWHIVSPWQCYHEMQLELFKLKVSRAAVLSYFKILLQLFTSKVSQILTMGSSEKFSIEIFNNP